MKLATRTCNNTTWLKIFISQLGIIKYKRKNKGELYEHIVDRYVEFDG